jgi:hypothetical protein
VCSPQPHLAWLPRPIAMVVTQDLDP